MPLRARATGGQLVQGILTGATRSRVPWATGEVGPLRDDRLHLNEILSRLHHRGNGLKPEARVVEVFHVGRTLADVGVADLSVLGQLPGRRGVALEGRHLGGLNVLSRRCRRHVEGVRRLRRRRRSD